jgi:hypothetical protein
MIRQIDGENINGDYYLEIHRAGSVTTNIYSRVSQQRLGKILNIVGHTNFYFECNGGRITLFGEYRPMGIA